ncbi:hypothetical protein JTB14_033456 [Gonioctena quinquepunctata]|nr:hypothetical protein JTB14_033456 [Gonioctena quinquepunctata]
MTTTKGFKVTDADRKTRVGIAVKNFEELKKKTIDKFKLKFLPGQINFQTTDGTMIENEEYFQTLPPQTLLIWVKVGEKAATDAEILYKTIREVNDEYLSAGEKVQEFFTEKMKNKVFKLAEVLKGLDGEKGKLSSRADHPEWFEGLNTNSKTKEEYMCRRAQDRIRTYYYKTRDELRHKGIPQNAIRALFIELDAKNGKFQCQGRWNKEQCLYNPPHNINPYLSREARIIFQTWNLDHNKERSRSIIPAISEALCSAQNAAGNGKIGECIESEENVYIDVKSVYNDLFSLHNLKLVHIVCHDKGAHYSAKAGPYL